MAILPLIGHESLRGRLSEAVARGTLPASLLLYGPAGAGKERLALWLGARLMCESPARDGEPCGSCRHCAYTARGAHPDVHWYFPRPKPKASKLDTDDIEADYAEAIAERVNADGPWPEPALNESYFVDTIRAIAWRAALTPAMSSRKVFVIAEAERMAPQEATQHGANAFLKLLEEPPANTTFLLTSSMRAALLPTIRSRVASVRVAALPSDAVALLEANGVKRREPESNPRAQALLDAARGPLLDQYRVAFSQGMAGARGSYSDALDALVNLLRDRAREAADRGDDAAASGATRGILLVEQTRRLAYGNVSPQALTARLMRDLAPLVS